MVTPEEGETPTRAIKIGRDRQFAASRGEVTFVRPGDVRPGRIVDNDETIPRLPESITRARYTAEQALDPNTPLEVLAAIAQDAPHLRPQIATNPSTYPALLEWLGNLRDPDVDAALRSRG